MSALNQRQKAILDHLLEKPEGATADQLAEVLNVTKTAAKEHIKNLEYLGYLNFRDEKGFVGRPKRYYVLSPAGAESFPRQYSWLSSMLLSHLSENLGDAKVTLIMQALADSIAADLEGRLNSVRKDQRLAEIVKIMNELGYRARLSGEDRRTKIIEASNCVYHNVAKENPKLCSFDIRLLEKTTKQSVKMQSCISRGGSSCKFCIG